MMLQLPLFVLVCTLGLATSSDISRRDVEPEKVSKVVPPPIDQPAAMARFIVNQADWAGVSTISTRNDVPGFPTANVIAVSDGSVGSGSGVPYMYLTALDYTAKDITIDNRASLLITLAQGDYCKEKDYNPMDPRCARVIIAGRIVKVQPDTPELDTAKSAVFTRHPWLSNMPANHFFFFAKLDIDTIVVFNSIGGAKYVTPQEYYNLPAV